MVSLVKVAVLAALTTTSISVQAGNYLFPTDVLPKGDLDVQAQFSFTDFEQNISGDLSKIGLPFFSVEGVRKIELSNKNFGLRYGVGAKTHVGILLSHSDAEVSIYNRPGGTLKFIEGKDTDSGMRNTLLFAKHQFTLQEASPYSLSATAALAANTANNGYTGLETTLSGGYVVNEKTRLYAEVGASFYDVDAIGNSEQLGAGLFYKFDPNLTFVPRYKITHVHSAKSQGLTFSGSRYLQSIGLEAQIALMPKTYLIPYFGFEMESNSKNELGLKAKDSDDGKTVSIGLYHYF